MTEGRFVEAASILFEARRTGRTVAEFPDAVKPRTFADGYRIQDRLLELDDRPVAVIKVGCTTVETQRIMKLDAPIAGCLAADDVHRSGAVLAVDGFHHPPLIECEFAMRLAVDLDPGRRFDSVGEAVVAADAVGPALELVDGRYDSQLGIDGPSVVADNSMAAAVILGSPVELDGRYDPGRLAGTTVRLTAAPLDNADDVDVEEELVAEGVGANVLGDPWRSFHWALGHLADRGRSVAAGTWIITGSCSGAPAAPLDRRLTAGFNGLGDVSVTITDRVKN